MKNIIKTFEPNTKGRDFVIGDLHGAISCLRNLMKNLNFDPAVDRMFSVGDLVDRGEDSLACLRLLREPWFCAVLANHEQMMYEAFNGGWMGSYWYQNGGGWGYNSALFADALKKRDRDPEYPLPAMTDEDYELIDLLPLVEEMPFLITINMTDGRKFHVLHAELPPGHIGLTDSDLSSPGRVKELATIQAGDGDAFMWSRFIFGPFNGANLIDQRNKVIRTVQFRFKGSTGPFNDKLSHIISGHTIMRAPFTLFGQTNIDTCAYATGDKEPPKYAALTCVELGSWSFYQATPTTFRTVEPFVVNTDVINSLKEPNEAPL